MDIYITTSSMLGHDDVKKLFASRTRKECALYVYCEKNTKLAISEVNELLNVSKKISIEFFEISGKSDFTFSIGLLVGRTSAKQQIYTILPEEYEISDSVKEQCGIKTFDASEKPSRITRQRKKAVPKNEPQNESATPQPQMEHEAETTEDVAEETAGEVKPATDSMSASVATVKNSTDFKEPLFFSTDAEKFFYEQLNLAPNEIDTSKSKEEIGRIVAECMKAAADNEQLLRFRLEEQFGEYGDIVFERIKKNADLLKGCLFIVRK